MTYAGTSEPTPGQLREIDALLAACAAEDGAAPLWQLLPALNSRPEMPALFTAEENGRLAGALAVFAPRADTAEITAAVRPACRRRGVFGRLLAMACGAAARFGHHRLLLPCLAGTAAGAGVANHWQLPLAHSEYAMRLAPRPGGEAAPGIPGIVLRPAMPADLEALAILSADAFGDSPEEARRLLEDALYAPGKDCVAALEGGRPLGQYCLSRTGPEDVFYGLAVARDQRGRGLGRALLGRAIADAAAANRSITLEVDSLNAPAFGLYRSAGFTVEKQVDYYACAANHFADKRM